MDATSQQPPNASVAKVPPPNTAGVLPVSTSGSKPKVLSSQGQSSRHGATGLKVVIRRLPPGLTENEFYLNLGEDWKAPGPRVDWGSFVPGKVSKDPAKHSRPARAYLHLSEDYVKSLQPGEKLRPLGDRLASIQLNDARGTFNDPALLNPWPSLSEAPYGRIPSTKIRRDNRQGTIDQDQEFIDFLQELTNPVVKPTPIDALPDKEAKPAEKIITPLVQYLKDKKANKSKEPSATGKTSKQSKQDGKDSKAAAATQEKKASAKSGKSNPSDRKASTAPKSEKPHKEHIKVLNKPAASTASKSQPATQAVASAAAATPSTAAKPERKRERERGSAAAAAKILKRDLGLGGAPTGRRRREGSNASNNSLAKTASGAAAGATSSQGQNASAPAASSITQAASTTPVTASERNETSKLTPQTVNGATPKEQVTSKQSSRSGDKGSKSNQNNSKAGAGSGKSTQAVTPTATQAFLKHANPSQGVTESLLQSTFAGFGIVTKVEIDKKKGFAYVDFAEPAALQKAVAASPVKVGEGQVVVLERKAQQPGKKNKETEVTSSKAGGSSGGAGGGASSGGRGSSQRSGRGRGRGGGRPAQAEGQAQSATGGASKSAAPPASIASAADTAG